MNTLEGFVAANADEVLLAHDMTHAMARSLVECAALAYKPEDAVKAALKQHNSEIIHFEWLEAVGRSFDSQAFLCVLRGHVILAFRGTESIQDFVTDAAAFKKPFKSFTGEPTDHLVHAGFQRALNALWSDARSARRQARFTLGRPLDRLLEDESKRQPDAKLWLTGHSLGAALATIAAARIQFTDNAPFHGRIGGLLTIGSPRVFDKSAATKLEASLGEARILRIYRSMDPVAVVPFWGFDHVSGERRAFVSRNGRLVVGARGIHKWLDRLAAFLRWLEDYVGSMIPGQHASINNLIAHHSSDAYLMAVAEYSSSNRLGLRDTVPPIVVPFAKLSGFVGGGWAAADATGLKALLVWIKNYLTQLL